MAYRFGGAFISKRMKSYNLFGSSLLTQNPLIFSIRKSYSYYLPNAAINLKSKQNDIRKQTTAKNTDNSVEDTKQCVQFLNVNSRSSRRKLSNINLHKNYLPKYNREWSPIPLFKKRSSDKRLQKMPSSSHLKLRSSGPLLIKRSASKLKLQKTPKNFKHPIIKKEENILRKQISPNSYQVCHCYITTVTNTNDRPHHIKNNATTNVRSLLQESLPASSKHNYIGKYPFKTTPILKPSPYTELHRSNINKQNIPINLRSMKYLKIDNKSLDSSNLKQKSRSSFSNNLRRSYDLKVQKSSSSKNNLIQKSPTPLSNNLRRYSSDLKLQKFAPSNLKQKSSRPSSVLKLQNPALLINLKQKSLPFNKLRRSSSVFKLQKSELLNNLKQKSPLSFNRLRRSSSELKFKKLAASSKLKQNSPLSFNRLRRSSSDLKLQNPALLNNLKQTSALSLNKLRTLSDLKLLKSASSSNLKQKSPLPFNKLRRSSSVFKLQNPASLNTLKQKFPLPFNRLSRSSSVFKMQNPASLNNLKQKLPSPISNNLNSSSSPPITLQKLASSSNLKQKSSSPLLPIRRSASDFKLHKSVTSSNLKQNPQLINNLRRISTLKLQKKLSSGIKLKSIPSSIIVKDESISKKQISPNAYQVRHCYITTTINTDDKQQLNNSVNQIISPNKMNSPTVARSLSSSPSPLATSRKYKYNIQSRRYPLKTVLHSRIQLNDQHGPMRMQSTTNRLRLDNRNLQSTVKLMPTKYSINMRPSHIHMKFSASPIQNVVLRTPAIPSRLHKNNMIAPIYFRKPIHDMNHGRKLISSAAPSLKMECLNKPCYNNCNKSCC